MRVVSIVFSPTGGTRRVAEILTKALGGAAEEIDLTKAGADYSAIELARDDTAVIAVPSFGGRVPAVAAERLGKIKGNGARCVLVCVYGNRAYEDTLAEMRDVAEKSGFRVIAAAAAIAEHSIARQYGAGRPDAEDEKELEGFARRIAEKIEKGCESAPAVPGSRPYKPLPAAKLVPQAGEKCVKCGLCARNCPVGAIDLKDPANVDGEKCIGCMRCVSICPKKARDIAPAMREAVANMLKEPCASRKENELFI